MLGAKVRKIPKTCMEIDIFSYLCSIFYIDMKEFVISEAKAETAVLVGLITQEQDEAKTKEYLDELEFLADTAGAVTVKRFTQKCKVPVR